MINMQILLVDAEKTIIQKLGENKIIDSESALSFPEMSKNLGLNRMTLIKHKETLINFGLLQEIEKQANTNTWRYYHLTEIGIFVYYKEIVEKNDRENLDYENIWDSIKDYVDHFPLIKKNWKDTNFRKDNFYKSILYSKYALHRINDAFNFGISTQFLVDVQNEESFEFSSNVSATRLFAVNDKLDGQTNAITKAVHDNIVFMYYDLMLSFPLSQITYSKSILHMDKKVRHLSKDIIKKEKKIITNQEKKLEEYLDVIKNDPELLKLMKDFHKRLEQNIPKTSSLFSGD